MVDGNVVETNDPYGDDARDGVGGTAITGDAHGAPEPGRDSAADESRFNFNTVAMASLAVIFVVFSVSLLSDILYEQHLDEFGYPVEVADAAPAETDDGPALDPVLPLLASADPAAGEAIFRRCASCHAVSDENKTGPGLNGIVGRAVAGHAGYGYSSAMTAHAAEAPVWSYQELNGFLWKPKSWVPGTSMGFAGLADVQERAEVIAYLRTISGDPPLPTDEEIAAATATEEVADDASAEGADGAATDGAATDEAATDGAGTPAEPGGEGSSVADEDAGAGDAGAQDAAEGVAETPAEAPAGAEGRAEGEAATDATAAGAVGDAGTDGAPVATDVETGQGVPGNETAADSVVDPDDLSPRDDTNDDPAAAVLPDGTVIDDAAADDAAAAGVPVAPLGGGEISEEAVEDAAAEAGIESGTGDATPVAPVAPIAPEVEGVVVDPTPDRAIVVDPAAPAPVPEPVPAPADATVVDPAAPVAAPQGESQGNADGAADGAGGGNGNVRTYTVPIQ